MPPRAAIADANENANSLATITLMPSAAAARSLVRTAMSRRPLRPRRTLATTTTASISIARVKMPYRSGKVIDPMS